jgi:Ca2+-binding EF-hand superfamily protein
LGAVGWCRSVKRPRTPEMGNKHSKGQKDFQKSGNVIKEIHDRLDEFYKITEKTYAHGNKYITHDTFNKNCIEPVFPAMPQKISQRVFQSFSKGKKIGGQCVLQKSDFLEGVCMLASGKSDSKIDFLVKLYDPKGTHYITLNTLHQVTKELDPLGLDEEASTAFFKQAAAISTRRGRISIKQFEELYLEGKHHDAPALNWAHNVSATLFSLILDRSYRYGALTKETSIETLLKSTKFNKTQLQNLQEAEKFIRTRMSPSGFIDGQTLLSLLGSPRGLVPRLVLQKLMRRLDTTNTGTISFFELVTGISHLGLDQHPTPLDVSHSFIFNLFADLPKVNMGSRNSKNKMSKSAFRNLVIAMLSCRNFVTRDTGQTGVHSRNIERNVSLKDIKVADVDNSRVDHLVASAYPYPPDIEAKGADEKNMRKEQPVLELDWASFKDWTERIGFKAMPKLRKIWTFVFVEFWVRPKTHQGEIAVINACCSGKGGKFTISDPGEVGTIWYMIPIQWWDAWYSGPDKDTVMKLPPMDNNVFFLPLPKSCNGESFTHLTSNVKKPNLVLDKDFKLVNARTFNALSAWYNNRRVRLAPVIVVPAFSENAGNCDREIEIYKLRINIVEAGYDEAISRKKRSKNYTSNSLRYYSRRTTLRELRQSAKHIFRSFASGKVSIQKTRMLLHINHANEAMNSNAKHNSIQSSSGLWTLLDGDELTLADLGIQDFNTVMLDFKVAVECKQSLSKSNKAENVTNKELSDTPTDEEDEEMWMYDKMRKREAEKSSKKPSRNGTDKTRVSPKSDLMKSKRRRVRPRAYKHRVPGVVGLKNMGNTCYMNASLQCLSACRLLREYFLQESLWSHDLNTSPNGHRLGMGGKLAVSFSKILHEMWSEANAGSAITPKAFKKTIGQFNHRFGGYHQQDAQELISTLLGALHEDLNRVHDKPYNEQPDSNNRSDEVVAMEWWRNHLRRDMSIITSLFTGQFKSSLTCQNCHYESSRFEPFSFLPVPLPENPKRYQYVKLYGHGVVPVMLSIEVEHDSIVKDLLEKLCKMLQSDHQDHCLSLRASQKDASNKQSKLLCGRREAASTPRTFSNLNIKDLIPVIIDRFYIAEVVPSPSTLSCFENRTINVIHAPVLGGDANAIDLSSSTALNELVEVNMNGKELRGIGAPIEALYGQSNRYCAGTIARVYEYVPDQQNVLSDTNVSDEKISGVRGECETHTENKNAAHAEEYNEITKNSTLLDDKCDVHEVSKQAFDAPTGDSASNIHEIDEATPTNVILNKKRNVVYFDSDVPVMCEVGKD